MTYSRLTTFFILGTILFGFLVIPNSIRSSQSDDQVWKNHPALAPLDGKFQRTRKMVAADVKDRRVLEELSRLFRQTGDEEYFLRLLDYYYFEKFRLLGMPRKKVAEIFGPLGSDPDRAWISGGRDSLGLGFENGCVTSATYIIGF
jgi:hypothetical protein